MIFTKNWFNSFHTVIITLLLGLIVRTIIALYLYPGYDEAYYYLYSKNLDWSYFDHPLFVALTTGLGVWITGKVNQFTIRIGTLIVFTLSLYLIYLTGKKLFNYRSALFTLIINSLIPIFTVAFGVLTLPDVPLIFFWTLTLWYAVNEFFREQDPEKYQPSYRLILICICLGLACLSKYHGFILGLGLVGFCLFNPPYRRVFTCKWLWWGFICFLATLFPLIYWNWQHDWSSFTFQLSGRFQSPEESSFSVNPLQIIVVALVSTGYLFPSFGFPLWWVTLKTSLQELTNKVNYRYRLILWISLPITLGFSLLGAVAPILPTWPMPGFWGLSLILGNYISNSRISGQFLQKCFLLSALIINTIFTIGLLHMNWGILQKPNQNIIFSGMVALEKDPSTELIDVQQLRSGFQSSPLFTKALEQADFVFTNQYFLGGYIAMAIAPLSDIPITCFGYDSRGFLYWYPPVEKLIGKRGIYITSQSFAQDKYSDYDYSHYFSHWQEVTQIPIMRSGEVTEVFSVYQGENLTAVPLERKFNHISEPENNINFVNVK